MVQDPVDYWSKNNFNVRETQFLNDLTEKIRITKPTALYKILFNVSLQSVLVSRICLPIKHAVFRQVFCEKTCYFFKSILKQTLLSPLKINVCLRPWARTHTVPVFRLWFNNSACRGCECAVAKERGEGWLSTPAEQFTSAPQKIRLSVSSTSLHCTFIQRAWRKGESNRQGDTRVNAHAQK